MKPSPLPAGATTPGRLVDPRSPDQRESAICAAVADLITAEDVLNAVAVIRRGLQAQTTIRAPKKPEAPTRNDYMIVDDVPTQLAAARLLFAYKFGNPASVVEMKLTGSMKNDTPLSRDDMIAQLRTSGADLNGIVGAWLGGVRKVGESGPLPADLQHTAEELQKLAVIEV